MSARQVLIRTLAFAIAIGITASTSAQGSNTPNEIISPAGPATSPSAPNAHPLFHGVGYSIVGNMDTSQVLGFGWNVDALLFAVGAGFKYDPNGLNPPPAPKDKFSMTGFASVSYMAYNTFPFAAGPELNFVTSLAPHSAFTTYSQLLPGLALWYAPFPAPLLIGTALQLPITFTKGRKATIETTYPGVRLIWGFP